MTLLAGLWVMRPITEAVGAGRRTDAEARTRYLIRQLHALGHQVTLEPAA